MKKILLLLLVVGIAVGCNHKKKGALWPLLALLNQDTSSSNSNGQSGVATETASASNGGGVVLVDNTGSNGSVTYYPSASGSSSPASTSGSSNSGSGSNASGSSGASNSGSSSSSSSSSSSGGSDSGSSNSSTSSGSSSSASGNSSSSSSSGGTDSGSSSSSASNDGSSSGSNSSSGSSDNTGSSSSASSSSGSGDNVASGGSSSGATGSGSTGTDTSANSSGSSSNSNSGSNSGSSNSGSGSSSDSGSSASGNNTAPPVTGVITVNDQVGTAPFTYNTVQTIPLNLVVTDKQSKPVSGATVIVSDNQGNILFQGISDNTGKVSGTITVETAVGQITLEITANGESITNVINLINVIGINREIKYEILLPVVTAPTDTDKDGVPDTLDAYPQDPTRSSLIRIPSEGVSTVAYEDLYPSAGDADLNDYVVHIRNEEDLNAAGDVIRLRGTYQHVARGAGYKHTFFIKLPVSVGAKYSRKVVRDDGKEITALNTINVSSADLNAGIQIHEESNKTTSNPNVNPGGVYKPGHIATIEIVFNSPVKKSAIGNYPYDIFIKVTNTGKEIHFPGLYKNANGTDKYLDSNQFPWAILVPGSWKYPYEGLDIRKDTQTGYKEFNLWVASKGTSYKDWYKHITNEAKVFPVPDVESELMGFLLNSVKKNAILVAILLMAAGATAAYLLKRRMLSRA
ncbi:LruC domain-containing protein [Leptospira kmetyi]|uniref:LruC domain-containing protein n=1 Tax=Leptospira kmetyi TaxID=408139 RepID=UPI001082D2DC|nr:LruC domain-containing protein [Leptospira kmetyi]TGK14881.1 LruC domain-containing protein [Leptospira kmetyi]TGK33506.1 LruC domain-containing protein [Leptospira kmetyi]